MAFPPGFLDELRSRISLSELIGRRVKLVRRGREFAGLCPFHHEKTPSFYVVEDKSFFHCFGCGAHGDVIGFAMRADNLDFVEAVEKLAEEAGLAVPQATPQERERAQRQKTLLEATEAAAAFYEERLWAPIGARAREYLQGRGLAPETIRRFRLGWAPDGRQALRRALEPEFSDPLLVEAGLRRRPAEGEPSDYFRNRLMFPISDRAGRVIAFGGRVIGDGQPKYLNSPESSLFEKGRVLYGWSAARAAVIRDEEGGPGPGAIPGAIVAEGYMDVIALHQAGFAAAVAPLGTALTEFQLRELWRLAPEPILCFDGDSAGQNAALRALHRALPLLRPGCSLRFAILSSGDDPDSMIRAGGRSAFEQVLAAARPLADMLWDSEVRGIRRDTPERLAGIRSRLLAHVKTISDQTVRDEFETLFKERCNPWHTRRKNLRTPRSTAVRDGPEPPPRSGGRIQRENLFRMVLHFPYLIDQVTEELAALEIPESDLDSLRRQILELDAAGSGLDARAIQQHLVENGLAATVERLLLPSADTTFLVRCSDLVSARKEWVRVTRMLTGGDRCALAEATDDLISDICPESWERFLAARERALHEGSRGDDEI